MPNIKLKPCPFCGGEAEIQVDYDRVVFVICKNCKARTYAIPIVAEYCANEVAAEKWNRRIDDAEAKP